MPEPMKTTSILLPSGDLALLRHAAATRASAEGGRVSVSDLIRSLIDLNRAALTQGFRNDDR